MIFYIDKSTVEKLKSPMNNTNGEMHLVFLHKNWNNNLSPYKVELSCKKISKEPIKQRLVFFWNKMVKKFLI